MAYEDYGYDPMGNVTGYVDQAAEAQALLEEERKRKEEERLRKENEKLAKERDNLAVHKQEVTTYANGSKTITNVAELPATANAPGRPNVRPVVPQGVRTQTNEFGGVDAAVERERRMNQQGQPRQLPRAPVTPQASQSVTPVAPDAIFQNQLQAESGNRQTDRRGQIMTSNKGALGIAQIMPATAMQPGYGVPDIFTLAQQRGIPVPDRSEATARQLLANKELNQEFGRNYSTAMRQRFGDQAGVAGYNMGPGAVERNMNRNQGQFNVAQAPQETQDYLGKVMRGVGNVVSGLIPSAQAAPAPNFPRPQAFPEPGVAVATGRGVEGTTSLPESPVAPDDSIINNQVADYERRQAEAQAQGPVDPNKIDYSLATGQGAPGIKMPGMKPTGVESSAPAIESYQKIQDNPMELMKLGVSDDPNTPSWIKDRARNRAADIVQQQRLMEKAQEQGSRMTPTETAKVLRKKSDEGSAVKLWMYKMLRMDGLAAEESDKLGFGREVAIMGNDNKAYLIKIGESGKPLSGYNPDTQKDLTQDELIKIAAGASAQKGAEVEAGTYMDPTGTVPGNWVLERKPGGSQYRQVGTGKIATEAQANSLRKTGVGGTLADQLASQRQKLQEQTRFLAPQEALKFYGKFDAENNTRFAEEYKANNPQYFTPEGTLKPGVVQGQKQAEPQAPAVPTGQAQLAPVNPNAPAPAPAPASAQKPQSPADIVAERERKKKDEEVERGARKDIITEAAKEVAKSADTQNLLKSINKVTGLIDSGEHNVGSVLSGVVGRGPIAQAIGSQFETKDARNTKIIMDTVQKLAADGLKTLGSNPSTVDLEFWTRFKPDASSDPEFVKEWIETRSADLKRRLGYAEAQVGAGGGAGVAPAVGETPQSPADKARAELERRKREKKN